FRKICQMISETKNELISIVTVNGLLKAEKFGVLDTILKHPSRSKIKFRYLTNVNEDNLSSIKFIVDKLNPVFSLKGKNPKLQDSLFPRLVIRDKEEMLLFINEKTQMKSTISTDAVLCTNCRSIIKSFYGFFEDIWRKSSNIKEIIQKIENGEPSAIMEVIKDSSTAKKMYFNALNKATKEIIIVTSSGGLFDIEKEVNLVKNWHNNGVSVKIMAPIIADNFNAYTKLADYCEVRHISQNFLNTVIIDGKHLFQFNTSRPNGTEIKIHPNISNTSYTNDSKHIKNTKKMLESLWKNSSNPSKSPMATMINSLDKFSFSTDSVSNNPSSKKLAKYFKQKPAISRIESAPGELFEKDVLDKILNLNPTSDCSKEIIHTYCRLGYAVINPPEKFNLPKMLIHTLQIDKKSSFGAEDRIVFYLWRETEEGFRYVPVAIIGDNPESLKILNTGEYRNTPAVKNFHLVDKKVIQFQLYGNIFLATWTIPVPLIPEKITLPPSTIIFETYGPVKPKKTLARYPLGQEYEMYCNGFDSFVTFMYDSSRYTGSGTDAFFIRDACIRITLPEYQNRNKNPTDKR
ncbi:MAG: hypothetical protein P8Y18_10470, partial [Candidatus Bathyarchaeota archaeon]